MAHVIIPSKSNVHALVSLVPKVLDDPGCKQLTIVADGSKAFEWISAEWPDLDVVQVPLGSGIHVMWNLAMERTVGEQHVLFLNDDVSIGETTIQRLEAILEGYPELGLVCPQYTGIPVAHPYQEVHGTCGGRYDGTGGLAGFCMMLRNTLAEEWRFDERMKWWCGDDDVLAWVTRTKGMKAVITPHAHCKDNHSWTLNNDPPADLYRITQNDIALYKEKWG
jgi:hypothetical protein